MDRGIATEGVCWQGRKPWWGKECRGPKRRKKGWNRETLKDFQ
jgi:hypothetical protein